MADQKQAPKRTSLEIARSFFTKDKLKEFSATETSSGVSRGEWFGHGRYWYRIDSCKMTETRKGKVFFVCRGVILKRLSDSEQDSHTVGDSVSYSLWPGDRFLENLKTFLQVALACEASDITDEILFHVMLEEDTPVVDENGEPKLEEDGTPVVLDAQPMRGIVVEMNGVTKPQTFKTGPNAGKPKLEEDGTTQKTFTNVYCNGPVSAAIMSAGLSDAVISSLLPDMQERLLAEQEE